VTGSAKATSGPSSPPVVLAAHLPYYWHAASALHRAGLLRRFVTAPLAARPLPFSLGAIGYFNRTRVVPGFDTVPFRRLWLAQAAALVAQRLAMRSGRGTALPFRSALWDVAGATHLDHPRIFHGVSGASLRAASLAKRRGALVVCDVRAPHPRAVHRSVVEALARRGVEYRAPDTGITDRMLREFDAADVLVCNSDYTRQTFLDEGFSPDRVLSVPLGCDPSQFAPVDRPPDRFTVLFAGRESMRKGLLDVLEAAKVLGGECRLVLTGHLDASSRAAAEQLDVELELVGEVAPDDMAGLYHRSSVLALPSLSEGFGMVVLEAMACGLPVVLSSSVGAAQLLTDGVDACVVPAGEPAVLGRRLADLAADQELVAKMGQAARATAEANTWDRYGERLVAAYRDTIVPLSEQLGGGR
jgi:glycosyltransferase involved in cell wall biosynthesis